MTLQRLCSLMEDHNCFMSEYHEADLLCGYEMETWTDKGVHMLHFIDCRSYSDGVTPENVLLELEAIADNFDVDEAIDEHRQDASYRDFFTVRESVHDFEEHKDFLWYVANAVRNALNTNKEEARHE